MINRQILSGVLVGIVATFIVSSLVVEKRLHNLRVVLDDSISKQEQNILELILVIGAGSGPETDTVAEIIPTCQSENSQQYDELLASLDKGLTQGQLANLNNLFNQCGSIPAQRRGVMVLLLEKEVQFHEDKVSQRVLLGKDTYSQEMLQDIKSLTQKEREVQTHFNALVKLQGEIIQTLLSGAAISSDAINTIQNQVQTVQKMYAAAIAEASQLRTVVVTP